MLMDGSALASVCLAYAKSELVMTALLKAGQSIVKGLVLLYGKFNSYAQSSGLLLLKGWL